MEGKRGAKKGKRSEEEAVETALAAVGAGLLVSSLTKLLPCILRRWAALVAARSLVLFLLLQLIIASVVFISTHPSTGEDGGGRGRRTHKSKRSNVRVEQQNRAREEEEGDVEEVNKRAEAFIVAFRQQLMFDYISSIRRRRPEKKQQQQ